MTELETLIDKEIPEGRQQMEHSFANLERVAAFCEANYLQATDKAAALEETRRYTVQSLASVAYQVNTLASNLLQMLDLQMDKVAEMESQVHNISQVVDIHKEKVARREIGVLTTNKTLPKLHKIIAPHQQERPERYQRRPIDYNVLDDFGHGVKLTRPANQTRLGVARTGSTVSAGSSGSAGSQPWGAPDNSHYFPTSQGMRIGSISKGTSKDYRTPVTVAAPMAPTDIAQRYSGLKQMNSTGYMEQPDRQSGFPVNNYSRISVNSSRASFNDSHSSRVSNYSSAHSYPSGVPMSIQEQQRSSTGIAEEFPPPPSPGPMEYGYMTQHSPPLPPPPMDDSGNLIPEMPQYGTYIGRRENFSALPDWVPRDYCEKVVAVYDYQAEKADELSFQENAVIYVLKKNEDGWFEGVLDGMTGLFPGNYVEACM